jgi:sec-independent protein translocase protein TatB
MFGIDSLELLVVAVIALLVIGPKDLPRVLHYVGQWVGKARRIAGHFRSGLDEMVRQAELDELEKKWKQENQRIMEEHPPERAYDSLPPPETDTPVDPPVKKKRAPRAKKKADNGELDL